MKFAVATDSVIKTHKGKTDKLRKVGGKNIMTLKKLEKTSTKTKVKNDKSVKIYEHTDPEFLRIIRGGV
jgi:hypothetical protein